MLRFFYNSGKIKAQNCKNQIAFYKNDKIMYNFFCKNDKIMYNFIIFIEGNLISAILSYPQPATKLRNTTLNLYIFFQFFEKKITKSK